ncbi:MAG: outer membrane protein assembly factor BamA [Phycisphaerae bacterium]
MTRAAVSSRFAGYRLFVALVFSFLVLVPHVAIAQAPEGLNVARVEFVGLETVSEDYTRGLVKTRENQPFSVDQAREDANELLRSRKFLAARVTPVIEDGNVVAVFEVREKPTISSLTFLGNTVFTEQQLEEELQKLGLIAGNPLDEYQANIGREEILRMYREEGYGQVQVEFDRDLARNEQRITYEITEGPRIRVRHVVFRGNDAFAKGELRSKVATQTVLWPFRNGAFDEEQADRDALNLQRFYRAKGYLDARVGYLLEDQTEADNDVSVVFVIEEGQLYSLQSVEITGNEIFDEARIRAEIQLAEGAPADRDILTQDARRIELLYGEVGYIDTTVNANFEFTEDSGVAVAKIVISESPQYRFGRITIRGNETTQDRVIRRELQFFPQEPYNVRETALAQRRLRETGLFTRAAITPSLPDGEFREALVEVEEGQHVNLLFGVGVSTDNGVIGSITIDNKNFDLFDWPRTFEEFLSGQAFRGAGQHLRIQLEPGVELSRFRIDFTEPYLADKPIRLDSSLYLFEREREGYQEGRTGFQIGLSKRFEGGILDRWAAEGTFRIENVDVSDVDALAPSDIRDARGNSFLTSVRVGLVRDTTDSRLFPTEGYRLKLSYEQIGALGGDYTYGRPSAGITYYKTLSQDAFERKSVLALRADAAYIVGDAPVFDRFYGGGFGSLRGFSFRGVSPRAGILDTPVGGDFILLTAAEYSFPLYGENVRGVTFLDMGTVEEGLEIRDWRASVGFGLRVNIDYLGPVPLVFDFGFPIARADEDDRQVFNFSFGASF